MQLTAPRYTPQIRQNHTKDEIVNQNEEGLRYQTTPKQTESHQDKILARTKKNHTKIQSIVSRQTKSHQEENFK